MRAHRAGTTWWPVAMGVCLGVLACTAPEAEAPALAHGASALGWTGGTVGKLRNKSQGSSDPRLCLDFEGAPAGAGALAQLYPCAGTQTDGDIQLIATTAPYYKLRSRPEDGSNLCLGFDSFASRQTGKLQACTASTVGEFAPFNPMSTDNAGYVQLRLRQNTALCLDVVGTPGTSNDYVQLYACGETHVDGHWRFVNRTAADACTKAPRDYDAYVRKSVTLPSPDRKPTEQVPLVAFDIQGHRGARARRPENSLAAFQYALEQGATTLEMDIIESADGVLVVSHDDNISTHCDYTRGLVGTAPAGHPFITSMTYGTLFDAYDCGHSVDGNFPRQESVCGEKPPRLENVIEFAEAWMDDPAHNPRLSEITYNIELKDSRITGEWSTMAATLHSIAQAYGVQYRTTVQTFDAKALTTALTYTDWTVSLLARGWETSPAKVYSYATSVWLNTPTQVAEAHTASKRVLPWTPNTVSQVQSLYALGTDGVITDDPEAMASFARICARPDNVPRDLFGKLKSQSREGLCLDFSGRPGVSGAEGQTWWCNDTDTDGDIQLFGVDDKKVQLRTRSNNLFLRIDPGATVVNSTARLSPSAQGTLDTFTVVPVDTGHLPEAPRTVYFQLRSIATDLGCPGGRVCLGSRNGPDSGKDETVELQCCTEGNHQRWAFCPGL